MTAACGADGTSVPPARILSEAILASAADAVIFADREGVIAQWNRACEARFGFRAEEAIGRSLDLIIPETLRAAHWRGYRAAMASGQTRHAGRPTVTRAQNRSGDRIYMEMTFALVLDETGAPVGSVAVARDVTQRV